MQFEHAEKHINDAVENRTLCPGAWPVRAERLLMMNAVIPGTKTPDDCVEAGCPIWLTDAIESLFSDNSNRDAGQSHWDRVQFARDVAKAVEKEVDTAKAKDIFCLKMVDLALTRLRNLREDTSVVEKAREHLQDRIHGKHCDPESIIKQLDRDTTRVRERAADYIWSVLFAVLGSTEDAMVFGCSEDPSGEMRDIQFFRTALVQSLTDAQI